MKFPYDRTENSVGKEDNACYHYINRFPNKPWFLRVCSKSLLKTLWEKKKLLVASNFFFFPPCFLPVLRAFCFFHQIWNYRLQTLSVWNDLTFVVWERVKVFSQFPLGFIIRIIKSRNCKIKGKHFPKQSLPFMSLRNRPFQNIVGKGENAGNQHFLLFPQNVLPYLRQKLLFKQH